MVGCVRLREDEFFRLAHHLWSGSKKSSAGAFRRSDVNEEFGHGGVRVRSLWKFASGIQFCHSYRADANENGGIVTASTPMVSKPRLRRCDA